MDDRSERPPRDHERPPRGLKGASTSHLKGASSGSTSMRRPSIGSIGRSKSLLPPLGARVRPLHANTLHSAVREGDLFIFQGRALHDAVIRCCTRSSYNHVAMVVSVGGELHLFESTVCGVGLCPLEFYINSYYWTQMRALFHKVVVRELHTRDECGWRRGVSREMHAELARYREEMLGRKFNMNPVSYMQALLSLPMTEDLTSVYCSELVAGAYKRLGLLPPTLAAGR